MSALSLPIFSLPSLIAEDILKKLGPFELFSLSNSSARSERVVRAYSSQRQFKVYVHIGRDYYTLILRETPRGRAEPLSIAFKSTLVSQTVFLAAENTVRVLSEDVLEAIPEMLKRLSKIFKINLAELSFNIKNENTKKEITAAVKSLNLKITGYYDYENEYNYSEVESLLISESMQIKHPKLTDLQVRRIFKKCMDRTDDIKIILHHKGAWDLFDKMARMVKAKSEIVRAPFSSSLKWTLEDGRLIAVAVGTGLVTIIIRQNEED